MIPDAYISSRTADRLRIKVPAKKRDRDYFETVVKHFTGQEGIDGVSVQPLTGSILISHHSDDVVILNQAEQGGLFQVVPDATSQKPGLVIHGAVTGSFLDLDGQVKGLTGGVTDIGGLAFLALVGVGVYQISRGNFAAPAWYTAFWYALNIFLKTKEQGNAGTE